MVFFLAVGHARLSVFANSVQYWESALQTTADRGTAIENVAIAYYDVSRFEDAERACREALSFRANNPHVHMLMGFILKAQSRDTEAARSLNRALKLKPDLLEAWEALAQVQDRLGDAGGASDSRRQALKLRGERG